MKKFLILLALFYINTSNSQNSKFENWKNHEIEKHKNLKALAHYVNGKKKAEISKDTLFNKYIYFDYVLNDTLVERRERRLESFDTIFSAFRKPIDSLGIENIDAKPIRFFKNHKIYEPFKEELAKETIGGEKMYTKDANVFAYYKKNEPEKPLKALLFDPDTNKLVAWIMINQGGYRYFLTFNLF
ncbi:hypothetical protein CLV86_1657 [Lacinutrix venerupis]|uniref:hypothetical protein n=1 Tax=Lacinutrix venerupis TaxID=1486034 RepID=UPI000EB51C91|nr:hypothetical protein [Lacinutrix venerupis]RLJ64536.1 hypothetical protein CLV86_1657 [Lacinutrix venerupis]